MFLCCQGGVESAREIERSFLALARSWVHQDLDLGEYLVGQANSSHVDTIVLYSVVMWSATWSGSERSGNPVNIDERLMVSLPRKSGRLSLETRGSERIEKLGTGINILMSAWSNPAQPKMLTSMA